MMNSYDFISIVDMFLRCWGPKLGGYFVNSIQIMEQVLTCSSHFLLCGKITLGRSLMNDDDLGETVQDCNELRFQKSSSIF